MGSRAMGSIEPDTATTPRDVALDHDGLFAHRAFYAEFAPLPRHGSVVDHLYVMKDRGIMTADRRAFASPFVEIAFAFRESPEASDRVSRIVVVAPSFGHRKKHRAFHGWIFGVRCRPAADLPTAADGPPFSACAKRLEQALRGGASVDAIVDILDRLCRDLALDSSSRPQDARRFSGAFFRASVGRLAASLGQSVRTLRRKIGSSTGLAPKRFLAVERFGRAVREVPIRNSPLATVAGDLGFADQAHLTREFRRHAGLAPGAFRRAWGGFRGQAGRFVQDPGSPTRLRMAVWAPEDPG